MSMVHTTKGLIARERLVASDIVSDEESARVTATEWHLDGELVRRDVHVNILSGQALNSEQGDI
jgi:hypothetical protein